MKTAKVFVGPRTPRPYNLADESLLDQLASAVGAGDRDRVFDLAAVLVEQQDQEYLPLREVSQRLTISERSVWRRVAGGELSAPVHIGGSCRWLSKDVREYQDRIAARRRNGRA